MKRTATASVNKLIYASDAAVIRHKARLDAKVADAVAALRLADVKLGAAINEYEPDEHLNGCLEMSDLLEPRYTARFFADMLDEGYSAALPSRIFSAIAIHANTVSRNTPHIEGAILALMLAERSLTSLLELAGQSDEEGIDECHEQPYAARGTIRSYLAMLTSAVFVFDETEALDAIVDSRRTIPLAA
jgi:hypothetical protein